MRSDLEAFLTWLSRPNPLNGDLALPAALTLKEQVNKNWQKLDTTSTTGPFSSPSVRELEKPTQPTLLLIPLTSIDLD